MKAPFSTLLLFSSALAVVSVGPLAAATLKQSEIKKFKGTYEGRISGITSPNNAVNGPAKVKVTGKSRELIPVLFDFNKARTAHFIAWRKPTGSPSRARFVGYYVGTFTNPITLIEEQVTGVRTMILVDRGSGVNFRYVMRLNDTLREGSYSAQDISGTLGKER
ncbi:MAG: hypothetical protein B9S36_02705 [Verrucomicrobiia bacterium Tous-C2TDCM]|nr:MAG: hypothetical protein B9S36_02705 [Verrucomicrobiae bacterium Tous-C2TDCM]